MRGILVEDECNDTYGWCRMRQALKLKYSDGNIPGERTIYQIMEKAGLCHRPKRRLNGVTKADRNARKSENLIRRDFKAGKLYVSAVFDCYASICSATFHSDRGSQYISALYWAELSRCGIVQSMNSDGGRYHDNARCEAMWARMKEEFLYGRSDTKKMTMEELKTLIWRYFIIYWNTRRICLANGGLPPMVKRKQYYDLMK